MNASKAVRGSTHRPSEDVARYVKISGEAFFKVGHRQVP
jgi:hypothetical protein